MKKEFDDNLKEQPEMDDLGVRAALESVEPDETARDRMFQNIMKKAAAATASEESTEAPRAEIVELPKKTKNRWKLYVPMLVAAGLILTIGMIFFASYGIERLSNKNAAAPQEQDNMPVADNDNPSGKTDGQIPDAAGHSEVTRNPYQENPKGNAYPNSIKAPDMEFYTSAGSEDRREEPNQGAANGPADAPTGDANISPEDMEIVENWDFTSKEAQTRMFSYNGHDYQVILVVDGCMEIPYDPARTVVFTEDDSTLSRSVLSNGTVTWLAEWSPDSEDWFYLKNADGAPEEDVRYLFLELKKNGADPEALQ